MVASWRVEARYARMAAKRWHASVEGKLAIYGVLFFAVTSFGGKVAAAYVHAPHIGTAIHSRVQSVRIPCRAKGAQFLIGISVWVNFEGHDGERVFCRDLKSAKWIGAH